MSARDRAQCAVLGLMSATRSVLVAVVAMLVARPEEFAAVPRQRAPGCSWSAAGQAALSMVGERVTG